MFIKKGTIWWLFIFLKIWSLYWDGTEVRNLSLNMTLQYGSLFCCRISWKKIWICTNISHHSCTQIFPTISYWDLMSSKTRIRPFHLVHMAVEDMQGPKVLARLILTYFFRIFLLNSRMFDSHFHEDKCWLTISPQKCLIHKMFHCKWYGADGYPGTVANEPQ